MGWKDVMYLGVLLASVILSGEKEEALRVRLSDEQAFSRSLGWEAEHVLSECSEEEGKER